MSELGAFRDRVRMARRSVGRTQQQLAREIGLHPHALSHKMNGSPGSLLNSRDAVAIVLTLAEWGGISSRRDAEQLLELAAVPARMVASQHWDQPPLSDLSSSTPAVNSAARWWIGEHVPTMRPGPLPEPMTTLVGRTDDVDAVVGILRQARLVTLLGAGGTGKTRVALQVAKIARSDFADGVAFADLAPVTSADLVGNALLRSLGLAPEAGGDPEQQLLRALRPARILLVVDNMEHLTAAAGLLTRLLAAAPELRILVTSRVVLHLYGEHEFRVRPLGLPDDADTAPPTAVRSSDAVELFCQRARAVSTDFDPVDAELAEVARICRLLDGLPLAVELAAARIRTLSPAALRERLETRMGWLGDGPRDLPRRQQSLAAALEWSEALLTPEQRRLFAHLGVFAGSFDATGAAAVIGQPAEHVLSLLEQLESQCLLEPADRSAATDVPRFRMLEPIREHAMSRLVQLGDAYDVRRAELRHYRRAAQTMGPPRPGTDADPELYRLFLDQANIRAALAWATDQAAHDRACLLDALQLVTACGRMWSRRSLQAEGAAVLQRLLDIEARTRAAPQQLRLVALVKGAEFSCSSNEIERTRHLAGEALEISDQLGDLRAASKAHRLLGEADLATGEVDQAMSQFELQLQSARQSGDPDLTVDALNMLGQCYGRMGRLSEARAALVASLDGARAGGDRDVVGAVIGSLAEISYLAGELDECAALWVEDVRIHLQTRTYRGVAYGLEGCAKVEAVRGHPRAALEFAAAAQRIRDRGGWVLPDPERHQLMVAIAGSVGTISDTERQQAMAQGRYRDLDAVLADAMAIARPQPLSLADRSWAD